MKLIGYWIQSIDDDQFPPPQELVTVYDRSTQQRVADYLDAGAIHQVYFGASWCRFFCDHPMGSSELTDGEWVWPEDLSHYVRDHDVGLPAEFIDSVLSKSASARPHVDDSSIDKGDWSWTSWCAEHRSHSLRPRIEAARLAADEELQRIKAEDVAALLDEEALSEETCKLAGCANRRLAGRNLCPTCYLGPGWSWRYRCRDVDLRLVMMGQPTVTPDPRRGQRVGGEPRRAKYWSS